MVLPFYDQLTFLNISFNRAIEMTVHRVVFQHVCQIVNRAKVVNTYDLDVVSCLSCTENETSDAAKSIDTYFNHCNKTLSVY